MDQAQTRNLGTCRFDSKGKGANGDPMRLTVPKLEGLSLHNRSTGTERPVVATIGRNGPGRQVDALAKAWPCGAKGACHRVLVQRVNHGVAVGGTYGWEQSGHYFQ